MNADRIIVVQGGEIVEQGSHDDLIRADGKYAELWSKQVFDKPKDKKAGKDTTTARKHAKLPSLVNDLTPEATSTELSKVKSAPSVLNPTGRDSVGDVQQNEADSQSQGAAVKTPSGHKKEV